jgi:diguanylate cyclase (GGDEF)-like protein
MGSVAVSEQHGRLPTRVCGAMMLAGGVLGVISVLMPPRAANSDAVVLVLAAIAIVFGGLLLRSRYTLPEWLLGVAVASGTALEERAILELARARRDGMPLSLVVIDLDDFKEHNDSRGHPAGDEALRSVANGLRRETRQIDAVARLGGDEFGVLLPGTPAAQALVVANRLRDLAWADNDVLMTLSIGVATSDEVSDFERLWNAADAAMYEAKRSGGDAVRTTPPGSAGNQLRGAAAG